MDYDHQISMNLHPIQIRPVEFDQAGIQCNLNGFTPNSNLTGRI